MKVRVMFLARVVNFFGIRNCATGTALTLPSQRECSEGRLGGGSSGASRRPSRIHKIRPESRTLRENFELCEFESAIGPCFAASIQN